MSDKSKCRKNPFCISDRVLILRLWGDFEKNMGKRFLNLFCSVYFLFISPTTLSQSSSLQRRALWFLTPKNSKRRPDKRSRRVPPPGQTCLRNPHLFFVKHRTNNQSFVIPSEVQFRDSVGGTSEILQLSSRHFFLSISLILSSRSYFFFAC